MNTKTFNNDLIQPLVYGISHDMGASLRSVIRFSELLQSNLDERLSDKEKYWLELIHQGGMQAQSMVDSLLIYSRLQSQASSSDKINLQAMIESTFLMVAHRQHLDPRSIDCRFNLAPGEIKGFHSHWQCLLESLLDNAMRYHPQEAALPKYLQINLYLNPERVTLTIEDNGFGMSDEHLQVATRPFMRGVSPNEFPGGAGMGLSYCERIAQLNQGELELSRSSLGGLKVSYQQELH